MAIITYTASVTVTYDEEAVKTKHAVLKIQSDDVRLEIMFHTNPRFACECYFRAFACGASNVIKNMEQLGAIPMEKSLETFMAVCSGFLKGMKVEADPRGRIFE